MIIYVIGGGIIGSAIARELRIRDISDVVVLDDIVIRHKGKSTHVLNALSPGMTCSLVFAEHVVDEIEDRI